MLDGTNPPHPEVIKAAIKIKFRTVRAFERAQRLPAYSVRDVLRGRSVRATAMAISDAVGLSVERLFPGRFTPVNGIEVDTKSQKRDLHRKNRRSR